MTDTSDTAIEAMVKFLWWQWYADDPEYKAAAMLLALQAERKAGWVARVKPLEWDEDIDRDSDAFGSLMAAPMAGVRYTITSAYGGLWRCSWTLVRYGSVELAQAAAQVDYTARILAALTPKTEAKP